MLSIVISGNQRQSVYSNSVLSNEWNENITFALNEGGWGLMW